MALILCPMSRNRNSGGQHPIDKRLTGRIKLGFVHFLMISLQLSKYSSCSLNSIIKCSLVRWVWRLFSSATKISQSVFNFLNIVWCLLLPLFFRKRTCLALRGRNWQSLTEQFLFSIKVKRIRLGTQEKVNKGRLHQRCLDDLTALQKFSGYSSLHWSDDITTPNF